MSSMDRPVTLCVFLLAWLASAQVRGDDGKTGVAEPPAAAVASAGRSGLVNQPGRRPRRGDPPAAADSGADGGRAGAHGAGSSRPRSPGRKFKRH